MEKKKRKRVPDFTTVRDEEVKILVNSCIRKMDRIRMRRGRKPCARQVRGKFKRAVGMRIEVEKR